MLLTLLYCCLLYYSIFRDELQMQLHIICRENIHKSREKTAVVIIIVSRCVM